MTSLDLPVLDLSNDVDTLATEFRQAGVTTGFMQVVNHGVPLELLNQAFDITKRFFDLPLEEKVKLSRDPWTSRGYLIMGGQTLQGSLGSGHEGSHILEPALVAPDQKEAFTMLRDTPLDHPNWGRKSHGLNRFPPEEVFPGFKEFHLQYHDAMDKVQKRMMQIAAVSLGTDPETGFASEALRDALMPCRLHHYPSSKVPDVIGTGAHTDFTFLTLLATNGEPGLQVYSKGRWWPIEPKEGAFIVNIGDNLARISGGRYKSSLHRVINNTAKRPRYSIAYFLEGNPDCVLRPLDVPEDGTYPTVLELHIARAKETFGFKEETARPAAPTGPVVAPVIASAA